jgi:hypothetical protein
MKVQCEIFYYYYPYYIPYPSLPWFWNTALPFWKLSVFKSLLGVLETFLCSISALQLKTVPLLDAHQLLMLSAGTLMYLKQILFPLVIFYNNLVLSIY